MTSFKSNLKLMRKEWYNAFYSKDIEQLDYLETEWFLSTNGNKVMYKKHQLRKIQMSKEDPASINFRIKRKETDVVLVEFNGIASVTGKATVDDGDSIVNINFIESWIKINDGWKIQMQTFEAF